MREGTGAQVTAIERVRVVGDMAPVGALLRQGFGGQAERLDTLVGQAHAANDNATRIYTSDCRRAA